MGQFPEGFNINCFVSCLELLSEFAFVLFGEESHQELRGFEDFIPQDTPQESLLRESIAVTSRTLALFLKYFWSFFSFPYSVIGGIRTWGKTFLRYEWRVLKSSSLLLTSQPSLARETLKVKKVETDSNCFRSCIKGLE